MRRDIGSRLSETEFEEVRPGIVEAFGASDGTDLIAKFLAERASEHRALTITFVEFQAWRCCRCEPKVAASTFQTYVRRSNGRWRRKPPTTATAGPAGRPVVTVGLQPIDGVELGFELVWSDPDHRQKPKRRLPPFDGTPQPIPVPTPFASASIRRIEEIVPAMMDYDKLVARLDAIDFECYDDLLRTYMCPLEVVAERLRHFPSTSRLIVAEDGVRIVGYWSVFPLLDKEIARTQHGGGTWNPYREFREGRAYDESLTIDLVPNLAIGGRFKAYIQSVCLLPRYRRCAKLLYESILDAIREFAEEDVYFDEVCAHGWKETGNRLCSDFDMTPVADHFSGEGRMFARALHPLPELRIVKRATRLCELYDAEFGSGR